MKKQTVNKLQKYVIFFYVYAFIGWIIDVLICFVTDGVLENRGFLYETLCPNIWICSISFNNAV